MATLSGLPIKTIRYYDDIGLLAPTVERSDSRYRLFEPTVLNRLSFVKRAQSLGLSLAEIQQILSVRDRGQLPCGEVRQHLEAKLEAIAEQIHALELLRSELQDILAGWQEQFSSDVTEQTICPNLQLHSSQAELSSPDLAQS
ncbi:heavy metal-responsive transcriptional regulator [Oscillatoria sp. FACHB-1407]|uniref:heavy metal-responsive transcriptional regulator n=1 Tax=Oscillatoria sp. FACHB-1407 TaxID=2692847 RepID=UPI0030DD51E8